MIYKSLLITSLIISSSFSLELDDLKKESKDNLTLKKVVELSLANDPWLLGNKYSQEAVISKSIAAGTLSDPTISINASSLPVDTFDTNQEAMTQLKIGISQMFPRGDTLVLKKEQLQLQASQFPFQREDRKSQMTNNVAQLWLDAYKAQESINLIEKNRSLFEQLVDVAESSYSTTIGKTRQQDIVRAQLELTRLDDRLTSLKQKKEMFLLGLSQWLYDFSNEEQLDSAVLKPFNFELPQKLPKIELLNSVAYENKKDSVMLVDYFKQHPSVKNIDQKIKAVSKDIYLAKQKYKPQFGLSTSYGFRDDTPRGQSRADLFSAGVSFDLPIFTENKQDKELQAAFLKTKAVKTEKVLLLRKMLSSFETINVSLERLKQRKTLYSAELLPQINEQAEASLTAYTHDDGNFSEVVRARIAQLNAKIDLLNIDVEIQKNVVKLNYLFINKSEDILKTIFSKGES